MLLRKNIYLTYFSLFRYRCEGMLSLKIEDNGLVGIIERRQRIGRHHIGL